MSDCRSVNERNAGDLVEGKFHGLAAVVTQAMEVISIDAES